MAIFIVIRVLFRYTDKSSELCSRKLLKYVCMDQCDGKEFKQKYVDILSLGGFNAFFGDENNKNEVMTIINELLPKHRKVVDIKYMPTEYPGPMIGYSKDFRYDFMCKDASGAVFIVELQKYYEKSWFKRCVSYASRAYDRQNKKGEDYDAVQPVYLIGLMGVPIDHPDKEFWKDRYVSEYTFREKDCHDLLGETIVIIFAELASFDKSEDECVTRQDRMLFILKNSSKLLTPPAWSGQERYTGILDACYIDYFDDDKRKKYDSDMYDERRRQGELNAAIEQGMAAGLEQGLERGREEGRMQGQEEAKIETAVRMKQLGIDVDTIVQVTGLSAELIKKL